MSIGEAYISGLGVCLPNAPVDNERIAAVLGDSGRASRSLRRRILTSNGIQTRHYAIDPQTLQPTHTNAELAAEAIRDLCRQAQLDPGQIQCLACGTSSPDQMIPSHASMVHACLGGPPCEVVATSGVCCSGMSALKYVYLNVAAGLADNGVATGSELASPALCAQHFSHELQLKEADLDQRPMIAFENDFLRWMLSDGAGAMLVTSQPRQAGTSLRIDWIELVSYASEAEICMYCGLKKLPDGGAKFWRYVSDYDQLCREGYLSLAQDVKVLQNALPKLMSQSILRAHQRRGIEQVDWLLPHYSSDFFRQPLYDGLGDLGLTVPWEKWFTNLPTKGNVGSASLYIIMEEFVASGRARPGDRILCLVPESARMTFAIMQLTVV